MKCRNAIKSTYLQLSTGRDERAHMKQKTTPVGWKPAGLSQAAGYALEKETQLQQELYWQQPRAQVERKFGQKTIEANVGTWRSDNKLLEGEQWQS